MNGYNHHIYMVLREIDRAKGLGRRSAFFISLIATKDEWNELIKELKEQKYEVDDMTCKSCKKGLHDLAVSW